MQAIQEFRGRAVPLRRSNVDTDQIIPSDWLKRVERSGFGAGLFSQWRIDENFVLNDPRYQGARILIAGENFGIGSSREHAVWALEDYGFGAVISSRFGDIFRINCTKVGVVPIVVTPDVIEMLWSEVEGDPTVQIILDIPSRTLQLPSLGRSITFEMDDFVQRRFLLGLDDIGETLLFSDTISAYESARPAWLPRLTV
ncbi:MAG: 3-isopropylmalate dehydratase small subunit [Ferrimicrobium sp.]